MKKAWPNGQAFWFIDIAVPTWVGAVGWLHLYVIFGIINVNLLLAVRYICK